MSASAPSAVCRPRFHPTAAEGRRRGDHGRGPGRRVAFFAGAGRRTRRNIRDWVHGFAADVVRPAAHEYDEREETPWPIISEAAKIGLYGLRRHGAVLSPTPPGSALPLVNEELFWGDAGIGMSIMGTALAVAADLRPGLARADRRVDPALLRPPSTTSRFAAFCASEPNAGLRRLRRSHERGKFDEKAGELGPQRPEGRGATNGGISDVHVRDRPRVDREPRLQRPRGVRRADVRGQGHHPGHEGSKKQRAWRAVAHRPTCSSTTAASPAG